MLENCTVRPVFLENPKLGDYRLLFALALTVAICSLITLVLHRRQIPYVGKFFTPTNS